MIDNMILEAVERTIDAVLSRKQINVIVGPADKLINQAEAMKICNNVKSIYAFKKYCEVLGIKPNKANLYKYSDFFK